MLERGGGGDCSVGDVEVYNWSMHYQLIQGSTFTLKQGENDNFYNLREG